MANKSEIAIQGINEYINNPKLWERGEITKRGIAKYLVKQYPDTFTSIERARSLVRTVTHSNGVRQTSLKHDAVRREYEEAANNREKNDWEKSKHYNIKKSKYYIVTAAQNSTPVHEEFWNNIMTYMKFLGASLSVIAMRYENPTSIFNAEKHSTWESIVLPYLDSNRHDLNNNITIMSDIKIRPTAVNPLQGMEGLTGAKTCVFGHSRVHLKTLPVLEGYREKFMFTTGMCTVENYTDSAAGKKGEFHHTLGFVIIEVVDDEDFHVRQVTACDDGSFTDLYYNVKDGRVDKVETCLAAVIGDLHCWYLNYDKMDSTFTLFKNLSPDVVVLHDVADFDTINPHDSKNPIERYHKTKDNNTVMDEIQDALSHIGKIAHKTGAKVVVAKSNHHDFLDRWINNASWKTDVNNAPYYLRLAQKALECESKKGLFGMLVQEAEKGVTALTENDSFKVAGFECSQHGHKGLGGSRGTPSQYRKLSTKAVTAHTHSPQRLDGLLVAGCSCDKRLGYNNGMSDWAWCDIIIHKDGKAQHIIYDNKHNFTTF